MSRNSRLLLTGVMATVGLLALLAAILYATGPISRTAMVIVFVAMALGVFSQLAMIRTQKGRTDS